MSLLPSCSAAISALFCYLLFFSILTLCIGPAQGAYLAASVSLATLKGRISLSLSGAILAVSLFGEQYPVELGRFERALYTMFKVVAGETAFPEAPLLVRTFSASLIL